MIKKLLLAASLVGAVALAGCNPFAHDSDVVSQNLSTAADQFQIVRRVVFYNGITGDYMLTIEGYCSLGNNDPARSLTVVCKVGDNDYKKHFLGLSDNVTYFVEQLNSANVDKNHYKVIFKPSVIVPDIAVK